MYLQHEEKIHFPVCFCFNTLSKKYIFLPDTFEKNKTAACKYVCSRGLDRFRQQKHFGNLGKKHGFG